MHKCLPPKPSIIVLANSLRIWFGLIYFCLILPSAFPMAAGGSNEHTWELSKENVAPLARGRDKASLDIALNASSDDIAEARAHHEAAIRNAAAGRGPHAADPLAPAYSYIKWAADAYQPRSPQLVAALEAVCLAFVDEERYRNDRRYVSLWVQYAGARSDTLDCLVFMRSKDIGSKTSLFYEAWATTLEVSHDFAGSDNVFTVGLANDAQPRHRLEQRRREFLARMVARDHRRAQAEALERKKSKGSIREGSLRSDASSRHLANDENGRPALASISRSSQIGARGSVAKPSLKPALSKTEFKLFVDTNARVSTNISNSVLESAGLKLNVLNMDPNMHSLAKADDVAKENEGGPPSKWAGTTLPQKTRSKTRNDERKWSFFKDDNSREDDPVQEMAADDNGPSIDMVAREEIKSGASPTINTRLAMKEVEEMFNSPLPFEYLRSENSECVHETRQPEITGAETANAHRAPASAPDSEYTQNRTITEGISRMTDWCLELIPDLPGFVILEQTVDRMAEGSLIRLQSERNSRSYLVESKLGDGYEGKSAVFAAVPFDQASSFEEEDEEEAQTVAIKVASTINLAWEFYIYSAIHARISGDQARFIPHAEAFFNGSPVSYLVVDRVSVATLAQLIEISERKLGVTREAHNMLEKNPKRPFSEHVAMFFVVELLKALEAVHRASIIHADVTLENIVVRNDRGSWLGGYNMAGKDGWGEKGIALIDFNHAIDARHSAVGEWTADAVAAHTAFLGNAHLDKSYSREQGSGHPWGFNADCHAARVCAQKLLFVEGFDRQSLSNLKHKAVWERVFEQLGGVDAKALSDETIAVMQNCRNLLENILVQERMDEAPLRAQLKSLFIALSETRLAGDTTRG
jgi:Mad3/BUB1 homology region 1